MSFGSCAESENPTAQACLRNSSRDKVLQICGKLADWQGHQKVIGGLGLR